MNALQSVTMAKMEMTNAISAVSEKYKLPAYIIELLLSESLSEIRVASKMEMLNAMLNEKENENADTESTD